MLVGRKPLGDFANGGGLPRAVYARHHHHEGFGAVDVQRFLCREQNPYDFVPERPADFFGSFESVQFHSILQTL